MSDYVEAPSVGTAKDNEDQPVSDQVAILLEANKHRKSALIINTGQSSMRITTDGSDPTPTRGKLIPPGASFVLSSPYCPIKEVKAVRLSASSTVANASEVE